MIINFLFLVFGGVLVAGPFLYPPLFPTAWFALLPLFWVLRGSTGPKEAFFYGWMMGTVVNLIGSPPSRGHA